MDERRFDRWTRALVEKLPAPRRAVLRTLLGGALATLPLALAGERASARCVALGKKCQRKRHKKHKKRRKRNAKCCEGRCKRKRCRCGRGREQCGTRCCPPGFLCLDGQCVIGQGDCPAGADTCSDASATCLGTCLCAQRFGGGTRCIGGISGSCGACTVDSDCAHLGLGAVCIVSHAPDCTQCDPGAGRCAKPCQAVPNGA